MSQLAPRLEATAEAVRVIEKQIERQLASRDWVVQSMEQAQVQVTRMNERIDNLKLIEAFLAKFADERQEQVYRQIEATVTEGLQSVFEEDIRLEVSSKMVGSRPETVFTVVSNTTGGELKTGVMDARGGGVASIIGFLIQAVLVLLTPNMRPIMWLDENFRALSTEFQAPMGEFIRDLCERTGLQVVLVTHQPEIAESADTWYDVSQSNGMTKVKKVRGPDVSESAS